MDTVLNKVFVDPNKNSKKYSYLTDFSYDKAYFAETVKSLKDTVKKTPKANKLPLLPKKWLPLQLYKGQYYAYYPCDGINDYKVLITDEYICQTDAMGMYAAEFNSLKMVDELTYINSEKNYYWDEYNLTINIIDKPKGIAIFTSKRSKDNSLHHRLMVDATKIKSFPLIINFCPGGKEWEFIFDTPDYVNLLDLKASH
ncbi:MAG: hypothetical protein IPM51_10725 [Sphingobacteriaceae bacterium]|nr:hypothetical protein [Sphingobacteriaceae bacterium]